MATGVGDGQAKVSVTPSGCVTPLAAQACPSSCFEDDTGNLSSATNAAAYLASRSELAVTVARGATFSRELNVPIRSPGAGAASKICTSDAPGEPFSEWWVRNLSMSRRAFVPAGSWTGCGPWPRAKEPVATGFAPSSTWIS